MMEVKRTIKVKTDQFVVGDIIKFKLNHGEKVQAMAVKQTDKGVLFVLVDCLSREYQMFDDFDAVTENLSTYENSDLRKALNEEILALFPKKIRSHMVELDNGDMLRIPTEREIFGENSCGQEESSIVKRWKPMKKRSNRIASLGKEGAWERYWLMNRQKEHAFRFTYVASCGYVDYHSASDYLGVRPVFILK